MDMDKSDSFWRRKLAAFLHDPPEKALDIAGHEDAARRHQVTAGFAEETERERILKGIKACDCFDAATERFGFPAGKCSHDFAAAPLFYHPFSGKAAPLDSALGGYVNSIEEIIQSAISGVETDDLHEKFFLYWRRWQENAHFSAKKGRDVIPFLPADSRIPDHTIWTHMAMTSALVDCVKGGRGDMDMLLFQFGPVQDFIAQARSGRDLWSGSYLLSWLMAHALKAVSDRIGPDSIVSPSLRGNGIFDALHRTAYYSRKWSGASGRAETTWQRIMAEHGGGLADWLLTPTLPNRFFAIVPAGRGAELAKAAEVALRAELHSIGEEVWKWLAGKGARPEWKTAFDGQIEAFPQITWAVQPWLPREKILAEAEKVSPETVQKIKEVLKLAEEGLPEADRDKRYYEGNRLNNEGVFWSAHYALLNAKLAARRNTRDFSQTASASNQESVAKDSLSGKEECIGDEDFWDRLTETSLFNKAKGHRYGAMNLIKRLWCAVGEIPYLPFALGLDKGVVATALSFDSVERVAHADKADTYVAVLALDGDHMGKWASGENLLGLRTHLAPKSREYLDTCRDSEVPRLLTPSYHLQFSEALSAFSINKARSLVESFFGELIYSGGDDVLAIVPAKKAIACAQAIRKAFRTDFEDGQMYPGSACDMSCGIAVGHFKAPLQMLVKEAQKMEHEAKGTYGRASVAIALYKRSGEIINWGTKWDSGALELMENVRSLIDDEGKLSCRFPYALAQLLAPYRLTGCSEGMKGVILAEVEHVLSRQGENLEEERAPLLKAIEAYLESTSSHLENFIGLFLAETFINRPREEE